MRVGADEAKAGRTELFHVLVDAEAGGKVELPDASVADMTVYIETGMPGAIKFYPVLLFVTYIN